MNWQENDPLIPESWRRPWVLWWTAILPQALLLWMNIQSWKLISGEMTDAQLGHAFCVFAGEVLLLAGHVGLFAYLWRRGKAFAGWVCGLSFMAHLVFYGVLLYSLDDLIPSSVSLWILPFEQFLYYQFALTMPAAFYALACLVCFPRRSGKVRELGVCVGLCVGIPLLWAAGVHLAFLDDWLGRWAVLPSIILGVLSTLAIMAALIRAIFILCEWSGSRKRAVQMAYAGLFGLVAPFGGLVLNQFIPFPVDFQSPTLYLLAALNGLALLTPPGESAIRQRLVWMARALMYPFTLYFFIVFLPFLPLTIPAMVAVGAGFLILTPTVLFLVHTRWLAYGFEELPGAPWKKRLALGVCVSAMPALLAIGAALDRVTLQEGLKYVYQSGPATHSFEGSRWLLRHSLYRLRDYKEGLHLPFVSAFYNKVVFDGLVLPDEKMHELHRVFFGQEMKPGKARSEFFATRSRPISFRPSMRAAPTNAVLASLTHSLSDEDGCRRLLVQVEMTNPESQQQEFATDLVVPEGVMVSGFWLHIGKERVPGRLFEKKTALWVYRMIRDVTRRDPGLLFYRDATHLELRVFPLAPHETRTVEIEFLYPESLAPMVTIGERRMAPEQRSGAPRIALVDCGATGTYVAASAEAIAALPSVVRRPYLHFIVDRSLAGALAPTAVVAQCRSLAAQFPEIADCAVTFANYELQDGAPALAPVESLGSMLEGDVLPVRGGFCRDRAIRHALTTYAERLCQATNREALFLRYPVIVVVTSGDGEPLAQGGLQPFMRWTPDVPWFYTVSREESLQAQAADGRQDEVSTLRARPVRVVVLEWGGEVQACPVEGTAGVALSFLRGRGGPLRVYDPARGSFQPLDNVEPMTLPSRYGRGAETWLLSAAGERDAARAFELQSALNAKSRDTGILVPATSYIVVENGAQWKMLELTEKKKLKNLEALEIASTPEPSTWALMILAGGGLLWKIRRNKPGRVLPSS